jgi:ACT domain-containing protein
VTSTRALNAARLRGPDAVPSYVMRIWLPDRPGALGVIASSIGSAGGDLVGIDILERGGDRVIDELTIELPDEGLVPVMLRMVSEIDGVDIEDLRSVLAGLPHPLIDPLEVAADILVGHDVEELLAALVDGVSTSFSCWRRRTMHPPTPGSKRS